MSREEDQSLAAAGVSWETWQQRVRSLQAGMERKGQGPRTFPRESLWLVAAGRGSTVRPGLGLTQLRAALAGEVGMALTL